MARRVLECHIDFSADKFTSICAWLLLIAHTLSTDLYHFQVLYMGRAFLKSLNFLILNLLQQGRFS